MEHFDLRSIAEFRIPFCGKSSHKPKVDWEEDFGWDFAPLEHDQSHMASHKTQSYSGVPVVADQ